MAISTQFSRKGKAKREKILEAASYVFGAHTYEKATIEEIARRSKLRKQSVYHYFGSKEEIFYEFRSNMISEAIQLLESIVNSDLDMIEKFRKAIHMHVSLFTRYSERMRFSTFQDLSMLKPSRRNRIKLLDNKYNGLFRTLIYAGIERGIFKSNSEVAVIGFAIVGMIDFMDTWYSPSGRLSSEQIANIFIDLVLEGLVSSKGV